MFSMLNPNYSVIRTRAGRGWQATGWPGRREGRGLARVEGTSCDSVVFPTGSNKVIAQRS